MRAELCLVGRHVDIDRAIVLAAFTGETQIERALDRIALPAVFQRSAMMQEFERFDESRH